MSVYGVGTAAGAPINLPEGGFLKDQYGQIVVPKLVKTRLQKLATSQGGVYASYTADGRDIMAFKPNALNARASDEQQANTKWRIDAGIYLLLLLVPMALLLLRNHAIALSAVLLVALFPQQHAHAANWTQWFKNSDQNALTAYQNNDYDQASHATDPLLKGAALYKAGDFQQAADVLRQQPSAEAQYNLVMRWRNSVSLMTPLQPTTGHWLSSQISSKRNKIRHSCNS